MPLIQFATQSYKQPQLQVSAQDLVNCYAEKEPEDAKEKVAVFGHPGLTQFAQVGTGPIRGFWPLGGLLYVVSGTSLYSLSSMGAATFVGSAVSGSNVVSMNDNGTQLCIVNGVNGYIYTTTGGFQSITSPNFFPANTVTFFDSYFVFDRLGTNQFFLSNLLDGTTFQATNIASADGLTGNVVGIVNQTNTLYVFGQTHMEAWFDAGTANFPLGRYDGATVERGSIGSLSIVKEDNSVFFMGDDLVYYRLDGTTPHRVSNHAIEAAWKTYHVVSDVFAFSYTWNGHKFIVLTFPTQGVTWQYDISTGMWHRRTSWDMYNNDLGRWRANCHINYYGMDLIGDAYSNVVGYLDPTVNTEYGNTVQALMVSPPVHKDRKRVFHDRLDLDMEVGQGAVSGQGSSPQLIMDYSDDGGYTWKNPQRVIGMGALGNYGTRCFWPRLGQSRQRVYRLRITDPVPRTLIGAHLTSRVGYD